MSIFTDYFKLVQEGTDDVNTKAKQAKQEILAKIKKAVSDAGYKLRDDKKNEDAFINNKKKFMTNGNNLCIAGIGKENYDAVYNIISKTIKGTDFTISKDNYWTLFLSVKHDSDIYVESVNDSVNLMTIGNTMVPYFESANEDSDVEKEFNIGNMLPQCGSTEGMADPNSVIDDINQINNKNKELEGITLPDDIQIESSITDYINDNNQLYNSFIDESVSDVATKVGEKVKLSFKTRKILTQRAILKTKLLSAKRFHADPVKINDIKQALIEKEKEVRVLKQGANKETCDEINRLGDDLYNEIKAKSLRKKSKNKVDEVPNSSNVKNECGDTSKECGKGYKAESTLSEKEELQLKLEKAMDRNDIDAIVAYENKLKYLLCMEDQEYTCEAANIDSEIKEVIDKLNAKGYKTKYSSAGHTQLRKKSDIDDNGIYYGKLYSDARIMFASDYEFPKAPKYWVWKTVDNKDYLDIIPIPYNPKNGTPEEAFSKWKTNYMSTLRTWVDNLPDESKTNGKIEIQDTKNRVKTIEA